MAQAKAATKDICIEITELNLSIRSLNRRLQGPIDSFDSWPDFLEYLDSQGDTIEFYGVNLPPSHLAELTRDLKGSKINAEHKKWLENVADKTELKEYRTLEEDMQSKRQLLSKKLDEAEGGLEG